MINVVIRIIIVLWAATWGIACTSGQAKSRDGMHRQPPEVTGAGAPAAAGPQEPRDRHTDSGVTPDARVTYAPDFDGAVERDGSAGGSATEKATAWIQHHRSPCEGYEGEHACYLMSDSAAGPWFFAYGGLQNFEYEWGHVYELHVEGTPGPGSEDAPAVALTVTEILTDVTVDRSTTRFEIAVHPHRHPVLEMNADASGVLLEGPDFRCKSDAQCEEMRALLAAETGFVETFGYSPERLPLLVHEVEADASAAPGP